MDSRKRYGALIAVALQVLAVILSSGCGSTAVPEIPELIEPVAKNAAYRPVEYGDIGKTEILIGKVVPTDYGHFFETNVTVSEITVKIGDYVKAGDVLARIDTAVAEKELEELYSSLEQENRTYEVNCRIAEARLGQLIYRKQKVREKKNEPEQSKEDVTEQDTQKLEEDETETSTEQEVTESGMSEEEKIKLETDYENQIKVAQENSYYDGLLHEYRVKKLTEDIAEKRGIIAESVIRARHDGYVTYIKNIAANSGAGANENVVIVSDMEDTYLELGITEDSYSAYADYDEKYLKIAGQNMEVTEIPYSTDERVLAKANGYVLYARLSCPGIGELDVGDNYPVYYKKGGASHVLTVANDSLYSENGIRFVYVQTDTGERERREVVIGAVDSNYSEVQSGLREGEKVYYESNSSMPADYTPYTVELKDFEIMNYTESYTMSGAIGFPCTSDYEGTVVKIAVEEGQEIARGDLLYVINTGEGRAALTEAQNRVTREESSYAKIQKSYDDQIAELAKLPDRDTDTEYEIQILNCEKELAMIDHEYRSKQLQQSQAFMMQGNDGSGNVSVYAPIAGVVSKISASQGEQVTRGEELLSLSADADDMILVQMKPVDGMSVNANDIADVGETVSMKYREEVYTGTCIGITVNNSNNAGRGYIWTDENGTRISYNSPSGYQYPAFWVKMDDASFYEKKRKGMFTFPYISMKDILALPASLVHEERKPEDPKTTYYYVWRVADGELIKQYVMVDDNLFAGSTRVILAGVKSGDVLAME